MEEEPNCDVSIGCPSERTLGRGSWAWAAQDSTDPPRGRLDPAKGSAGKDHLQDIQRKRLRRGWFWKGGLSPAPTGRPPLARLPGRAPCPPKPAASAETPRPCRRPLIPERRGMTKRPASPTPAP